MKFSNLEAIRDWCKDKFQPKGNYLTEVPIATDESIGAVKPDGETIKINEEGILSANNNNDVTGVKGCRESTYRKGNVNITAENIGALSTTGGAMTGNIEYQGTKAKHTMIKFLDNILDGYGNGIEIGGGGAVIIGGGESAQNIEPLIEHSIENPNGGIERLLLCNDQGIDFYTGVQNGAEAAVHTQIDRDGNFTCNNMLARSTGKADVVVERIDSNGNVIATGAMSVSSGNNFGLWDGTHNKWMCFASPNGTTRFLGTADNLSYFKCTSNVNVGLDDTDCNAIGYVTGTEGIIGQHDGAYYRQAYSSNWVHEIYGDYRTGQLAVRGKNNGTWQLWRKILDSSNYSNYVPTKTGTGASGTWGINITGTATKATSDSDGNVIKNTYMKIANSIINNLNSTSTTAALSANMGHFIKDFCSLKHIITLGGDAWEAAFSDEIYLGCGTFLTVINAYNATSTTMSEPKYISFNIWTADSNWTADSGTSGTIKRVTIGASSTANVTASDYYSTSYSNGTIKITVKKGKLVEYNIFQICSGGSAI